MSKTTGTVYECDGCGTRTWSETLPKGWWERPDKKAHLCRMCELGWQMAQKAKTPTKPVRRAVVQRETT